ncbi:hypothetical protein PCCS19_55990 [Paenibacillus sp. CCS19]|uniref:DUF3889 domain-containing protein n=1 Tax=Paenibacillus sp. CCS19 TaxID=3158387 RepID=UPI00255FCC38|nr:DUF3889 domain-containing protein [Paenibacillus cellulosilyticus]GMK42539.1 hypothetical protein PCCS19_55990 [Paenibacillus cellulosilyticus]
MSITKWTKWFIAGVLLTASAVMPATRSSAAVSARLQPEYAKWGQQAVDYAINEYKAEVIDYAYEGRFPAANGAVDYRFRLWVRKASREYAVRIAVSVNPSTGERVGLKLTELQ